MNGRLLDRNPIGMDISGSTTISDIAKKYKKISEQMVNKNLNTHQEFHDNIFVLSH